MSSKIKCTVYNLSHQLTDYATSWQYQKLLMEHMHLMKKKNCPINNSLLLVQHPTVYTLGRGATSANLKFDPSISSHSVMRVERGGEVTWHGPGQIVAYPIFDLSMHKKDLHWFAHSLEQSVLETLDGLNIEGERSKVNTGVWVGNNKISAIGVTASRWITMHGIALNVNCDLDHFNHIVPCGISLPERGVCSLKSVLGESSGINPKLSITDVANRWIVSFQNVFNLEVLAVDGTKRSVFPSVSAEDERATAEENLKNLMKQYPDIKLTTPERVISK